MDYPVSNKAPDVAQAVVPHVLDGDGNAVPQSPAAPQPVGNAELATATATIANGESLSAAVDLGTGRLAGIVMPAAWTAANLTFQTSPDGVTWRDRYDWLGGEVTVVAAAARSIQVNLADWLGVRFLKVRSGTSGTPVNQGAERVLTLVLVR